MRNVLLSLLVLPIISLAGEADVLSVKVSNLGGNFYRFDVTVQHTDEDWNHFAKAYEVLAVDGTLLGSRILRHPHINEQPFTRSLTITIPEQYHRVTIRAYDLVHEYGGKEFTLNINREQ